MAGRLDEDSRSDLVELALFTGTDERGRVSILNESTSSFSCSVSLGIVERTVRCCAGRSFPITASNDSLGTMLLLQSTCSFSAAALVFATRKR